MESIEEETVREYIAQSRGELKIVIPEKEKGYVSKTYEAAKCEKPISFLLKRRYNKVNDKLEFVRIKVCLSWKR